MKALIIIILISSISACVGSDEFSTIVDNVKIDYEINKISLNADIEYRLSPTAKEALQKGIPLSWLICIKVQKIGFIWNETMDEIKTSYQIQHHALLNLYSVTEMEKDSKNMYSTLTAALDSISKIRNLTIINKQFIHPDKNYQLAIKVLFDREALPVPLRPMSYFNTQWALSSSWSLWQLQN